ncbi:glycoside hydrolase family 2 TIM barrel-domain containing protein [Paenibacillus allorhizoplanae]|nr:glycoside hydrolase family 2 TIM barrel-domain containing protein [Paenibacillus allorhizoplanae]
MAVVVLSPLLLNLVALGAPMVSTANATTIANDGTRNIDFNDDWQFYLATRTPTVNTGGVKNGLQDPVGAPNTAEIINPAFDASSWRTVNVPHDWSIEGQKVSSSSNSQGYLEGGLGWYRKNFVLPDTMSDKKIAIDFEGVYTDSIVYVNGNMIGEYPSGYTGFSYDITPYLTYGDDSPNIIVVKVQNMSPTGRWYTGSGITRPVHLVVTDKTRFLRNGITYTTPDLESAYNADHSANVVVSADLYSEASNGVAQIRTSVIDANGNVVSTNTSDPVDYNPSTKLTLNDSLQVPNVHLWSTNDPYLYTIRTELITEINGGTGPHVVDAMDTSYGFRWIKLAHVDTTNANTIANSGGFYLNGVYTKLQGVDLHHDDGSLGAADNLDAAMRKFKILKDMGVNAYRTSHNPPSKQVITACERLGIVVIQEAFDGWGAAKATYDFGNWFLTNLPDEWKGSIVAPVPTTSGAQYMWSDWVIQEMVNRDKNSPSIIMWSLGNEVRGAGTKPAWMDTQSMYGVSAFNEYSESIRLMRDVQALDPTRPIVMGGDQERTPPSTTSSPWGLINNTLSGYGLNYNTAQSVDVLMTRFPNTSFFESESSSQTSARGVYQDPTLVNTGVNQTPGSRGTSSYDNNFASWTMGNEYGLKKDRDRKAFIGQFIWSGFDYIGEPTPYSIYPVGVSSFGAIDTAGFPKDSFYLFKSQWNSQPMAHILPMNWTNWRQGETVDVWVNTNQQSAELFLNGVSLGRKSFDIKTTNYGKQYYETTEATQDDKLNTSSTNTGGYLSPNGSSGKLHFTWKVPFTPGTLEVKTYANTTSNVVTATDVVKTAGQAYTVSMTPDKNVITADGRSLSYIEADIVDKDGNIVPDAGNLVKFDVTGGAIVGVDNGKQESNELYKWGNVERNTHSERSAYNGKVLVIVQSNKGHMGPITVHASFDGSLPAQATVFAQAANATGNAGILPLNVSVMKDSTVNLPSNVTVVHADGTTSQSSVNWTNVPSTNVVGAFKATAQVGGLQAVANVNVYDFANASVNLSVATGDIPVLPAHVKVNFTNGLSISKPVVWPSLTLSQVQASGTITVEGQIADLTHKAIATINVSNNFTPNVNLAASVAGTGSQDTVSETGPIATATFTNGSSYPNLMLDGNKTSGGWTNKYSIAATANLPAVNKTRPYEFVQVNWPQLNTFSSIKLYFTTGGTAPTTNLPKSLDVQYWDGLHWVSAGNQNVIWATASNQASAVTFDMVTTTKIRIGMENATPYSANTGGMAITELEVYGNKPTDSGTVASNQIPHSQMTASATSEELFGENNAASMVLDGDPNTIWHTKWDKSNPLPQSITLNLGGTYDLNKIKVLPRQDGQGNGMITAYNVYASMDGIQYTEVISGTWAEDAEEKTAEFPVTRTSFIQLKVTAGVGGYASAAEINVFKESPKIPQLIRITVPANLTGVANGTAKSAASLGLPSTVELVTDSGSKNANVAWNVDAASYNPAVKTEQTFTVNGTVTLPVGVVNPNNVVLTTSISVNVLPTALLPQSTLTGLQEVTTGQTFDVTMGLSNVTQSVYQQLKAQDLTLHYDPAKLQFESVTSVTDGFQVYQKETVPGQIRIVAASVGAKVSSQGDMFSIKFTAKSLSQTSKSTISVESVVIANEQGNELQIGGVSRELQINIPSTQPVDKSLLNASIASAQAKYTAAVEGNIDGLYTIGSKAQLQSAMELARATVNEPNATQQQVNSAKATLEVAVEVFESKKITADINGGGVSVGDLALVATAYDKQRGQAGWNEKADVNHDGKVDIVDLAIVAKAILQ